MATLSAISIIFSLPLLGLLSVPLDPDQKVYDRDEIFRENFLTISFPEKALVRTESRKRWRAVPLKDRQWILIWRKLDRAGEFENAKESVLSVFPEKPAETFSVGGTEILRWTKEDVSGGNPLKIYFFLIRQGDSAYTVYVAMYRERQDLNERFASPERYVSSPKETPK
ncbi:hypothetical protein EHO60_16825 [Leptospira fletcheri]|uniref:Uncharacterized protein n=1 Tax=Leptospira fletcheri TaxID=2484981 RepID=A0A4R9G5T0_9LEPT|nr:hypothetical protein EHO60_16825 [Leptospira fletcheri]